MKIRNGFVSNSSSGSFILNWRMRTFGKEANIQRAVGEAFKVFFKEGTDEIDWEGTWNKEVQPKVEEVFKNTVKNYDGSFTSTFWTSMANSAEDYGEAAKSLVIGLVANNDFEIVDAKTESDY